jgi:hypothetical protein
VNVAISVDVFRSPRGNPQGNQLSGFHRDDRLLLPLHLVPAVMVRQDLDHSRLRLGALSPTPYPGYAEKGDEQSQIENPYCKPPSHLHCVMYRRINLISSSVIMARTLMWRIAAAMTLGGNLCGAM